MPRKFDIVCIYRSVDNEAILEMLAVSKRSILTALLSTKNCITRADFRLAKPTKPQFTIRK